MLYLFIYKILVIYYCVIWYSSSLTMRNSLRKSAVLLLTSQFLYLSKHTIQLMNKSLADGLQIKHRIKYSSTLDSCSSHSSIPITAALPARESL